MKAVLDTAVPHTPNKAANTLMPQAPRKKNQPRKPTCQIDQPHEQLGKPFVGHPRILRHGKSKHILRRDAILQNELPGAQMPPHIRVQRLAHRHCEESHDKQGHKQTLGVQISKFTHRETRY